MSDDQQGLLPSVQPKRLADRTREVCFRVEIDEPAGIQEWVRQKVAETGRDEGELLLRLLY